MSDDAGVSRLEEAITGLSMTEIVRLQDRVAGPQRRNLQQRHFDFVQRATWRT
jgi:hypothetical protein